MNDARSTTPSHRARKATIVASMLSAVMLLASAEVSAQGNRAPQNFTVLPITITSVTVQDGQLVANGLIGTSAFQTPLLVGSQATPGVCPILDLSLGPIDLNLLGLPVQTSPICLELTAVDSGGLLGDLLCEVANLLQGGVALPDVLAQLQTQGTLSRFLNGLTTVLNQVVDRITANTSLVGASCSVLSLAVAPVHLDLLGLVVELDNCANRRVTLDITAIPGGGVLGDLLCRLGRRPLDNPLNSNVQRLLWNITRAIGRVL